MNLVYIYGPPASGKLTVAERLSELTGFPLFHNHLTVNVLRTIFPFGTKPYTDVTHKIRQDVFETAAEAGISLVFTNNSAWAAPDPRARFAGFADSVRTIVEDRGGRVLFVRLTASQAVLEERLSSESRVSLQKLVDIERLRELVADIDLSSLHADDLVIDTGNVSPEDAAKVIARELEVRSGSGTGATGTA
ncbi:MAG TPA: AAA family ATPase [Trebonia sp.]|nr:AAA family ATPase [Trebonia sp.]